MRDQILKGSLELPSYQQFLSVIGPENTKLVDKMFKALWLNYLKDKGSIPLTYWYDKFNNPLLFNKVLITLANAGWIITHSIEARNWAEGMLNEDKLLKYVTMDELEQVRAHNKFKQYRQTNTHSSKTTSTRINGSIKDTGLIREGFCKAGNTAYKFDTNYITNHYDVFAKNLTKSMDKIAQICPNLKHDKASYDTISVDMLDWHISNKDEIFTRGNSYNDSRGRAISSVLSKIANPISNKDFRALLVIPI